MRGLVLGRFQPLHKGHQALIRQAVEDCQEVVVGVGSTNVPRRLADPFSFEERRAMIQALFPGVEVVAVGDLHNPPRYVAHVLDTVGGADRVYGNSDSIDLFEDDGIPVRRPGLQTRDAWEGKLIRWQLAEDDGAWRKAVPPQIVALLDELDAPARLRSLA